MTDLIDLIETGISSFQGADWRHEYTRKGQKGSKLPLLYCEGRMKKCSVCAEVRKDARLARSLAEQAIAAVRDGNLAAAHFLVEKAYYIQHKWGDASAYRPAAAALAATLLAK